MILRDLDDTGISWPLTPCNNTLQTGISAQATRPAQHARVCARGFIPQQSKPGPLISTNLSTSSLPPQPPRGAMGALSGRALTHVILAHRQRCLGEVLCVRVCTVSTSAMHPQG